MDRYVLSWADRRGTRAALFTVFCFTSLAGAQSSSSTSLTQCVPTPISVAIKNITVANSPQNAIARGVAISVGTPPQDFAFLPYTFNNSFIYDDTNLCTVTNLEFSTDGCITVRGGAYDVLASTTQKQGGSDATAMDSSPYPSTSIYSDVFTLNDQIQLSDYTFGVPLNDWGEQFYHPQALLGLGTNSTFLNSLKEENLIASRSWSFFWGKNGRGQQSNGSMVFGGYDKAKIQGTTNYTRKLNYTNCEWGTTVEISALGLIFLDASTKSLFDTSSDSEVSQPLYGCIDPVAIGIAYMPYNDYFANFWNYTAYDSFETNNYGGARIRSSGYNFWDLLYLPGDQPFLGDLNVTIKHGPSIRVENDQLVVPHVYLDSNTNLWEQNTSLSDLLLNSLGDIGNYSPVPLTLGRDFFTFVYLMINLDAEEFTLWPAYSNADDEDLIAVDENNNPIESSNACTTNTATPTPASSSTSPAPISKISAGAIAGVAIGAVAVVALILVGSWLLIRHLKKQNVDALGSQLGVADNQPAFTDNPNKANEIHSNRNTMHELPGWPQEGTIYELESRARLT